MENNVVNEFLGLEEPKENPFEQETTDPFASQEAEEKEEGEATKVDEKPLPFHKDPKVQKFIDKEVSKRLENFKPETVIQGQPEDEITELLTRVIGNDTPEKMSAIKDFKKVLLDREEKGAEKALKQFRDMQEEEKKAAKEALAEVENGLESIEETFNVDLSSDTPLAKKTRTEYLNFVQRIAPKNEEGGVASYPDFQETFKLFQETKKSPPQTRAKALASRGMSRSTEASTPAVKGNSWSEVEKFFNKLGN